MATSARVEEVRLKLPLMALLLVLAALLNLTRCAGAHSWYDSVCCSGQDCRPVPAKDVRENPDGSWAYTPAGVTFSPKQVKHSQDQSIHVCYYCSFNDISGEKFCAPRCIYLPDPIGS